MTLPLVDVSTCSLLEETMVKANMRAVYANRFETDPKGSKKGYCSGCQYLLCTVRKQEAIGVAVDREALDCLCLGPGNDVLGDVGKGGRLTGAREEGE
ncbi:hypothetical protein Trydic_g21903 [Trypoxylus dichotomus]